MHRIDEDDDGGLFKTSPAPATVVTKEWANDVQENLARVIEAFGVALVKGDYDQLKDIFASIGLPGRAAITNLDTLDKSGFFATSAGATGRPAGEAAGNLLSVYDTASDDDGVQMFFPLAADRIWVRRWSGAAWEAWFAIPIGGAASAGASVAAKAANGLCSIYHDQNIASVTRVNSGEFAVLFTTALADANYTPLITCGAVNVLATWASRSTAGFTIFIQQAQANNGASPQNPDFGFRVFG